MASQAAAWLRRANAKAGARVGKVLIAHAALHGAGWLSGAIFNWAGSYRAAFVNGIA